MIRTRLAALVLAASLVTLSGCCCKPWPFSCIGRPGCCNNDSIAGASPVVDGPVLMSPGAAADGNLPLAPVPRALNSQPMPYTP